MRGYSTLDISETAVVGNQVSGSGAMYITGVSDITMTDSVITGNQGGTSVGGIRNSGLTSVTLTRTIVADNSHQEVYGVFISGGNNLLGNIFGAVGFIDGFNGDQVGQPHYVVSGLMDTFSSVDDGTVLSLRESVDLANQAIGLETIFVPAWNFRLTREGDEAGAPDVSVGDLDVFDDLDIVGIATGETTIDSTAVNDAVFEEVGASLTWDRLTLVES